MKPGEVGDIVSVAGENGYRSWLVVESTPLSLQLQHIDSFGDALSDVHVYPDGPYTITRMWNEVLCPSPYMRWANYYKHDGARVLRAIEAGKVDGLGQERLSA